MTDLRARAQDLGLQGLIRHFDDIAGQEWVGWLLRVEEEERGRRSLERRIGAAKLGRFKSLADFDWSWASKLDRSHLETLFGLGFIEEQANIVFVGPNGVGKTMLSKNLAHRCLLQGHSVAFTTASAMLNTLASEDSASGLQRRLKRVCNPRVLCIDEVGYLSYGNRHADLLFEVVTRRYELGRPIVITTNKPFGEWGEVFPNASCVVTLVDRLVHRSEVVQIEGSSYRLKEAQERHHHRKKPGKEGGGEPS